MRYTPRDFSYEYLESENRKSVEILESQRIVYGPCYLQKQTKSLEYTAYTPGLGPFSEITFDVFGEAIKTAFNMS